MASRLTETCYLNLVERAGGVFVSVKGNSVYFRAEPGGRLISLYLTAFRNEEDVRMALKAHRELMEEVNQ